MFPKNIYIIRYLNGLLLLGNYNSDYKYGGTIEIREGSMIGNVIGKTALGHVDKKKEKEIANEIALWPMGKRGDLYLVMTINQSD